MVALSNGNYRANRSILGVLYPDYSRLFRQKNTLFGKYNSHTHSDVTVYEFFLPLTCEDILRRTLDFMFYRDSVVNRLLDVGIPSLVPVFPRINNEADDALIDRVCDFVAIKFGGYSISHVAGRFRGKELLSRDEANKSEKRGDGYLFDETTAVVRFILPHYEAANSTEQSHSHSQIATRTAALNEEVERTTWLFNTLFVDAVKKATTIKTRFGCLKPGGTTGCFGTLLLRPIDLEPSWTKRDDR